MSRLHGRALILIEPEDFDAWFGAGDTAPLLRSARKDSLHEWIVSPSVNRSGSGDDDPTLIEPLANALGAASSRRATLPHSRHGVIATTT